MQEFLCLADQAKLIEVDNKRLVELSNNRLDFEQIRDYSDQIVR